MLRAFLFLLVITEIANFQGAFGQCEDLCSSYIMNYENQGKMRQTNGDEITIDYLNTKWMRVGDVGTLYQDTDSKYASLESYYPRKPRNDYPMMSLEKSWYHIADVKIIAIHDTLVTYQVLRQFQPTGEEYNYQSIILFEPNSTMIIRVADFKNGKPLKVSTDKGWSEGCSCNGHKYGDWKFYDKNGSVYKEVRMSYDTEVGPVTKYNSRGDTISIGAMKEGERYGIWKEFHSNGVLASEKYFLEGRVYGAFRTYHDNGQLDSMGIIDYHGNREGSWNKYYASGQLAWEAYYDSSGDLDGPYVEYYENGNLKIKGEYDKWGDRINNWEAFYKDGAPKATRKYTKGGVCIAFNEWYPNGNWKNQCKIRYGDTVYVARFFDNGQLKILEYRSDNVKSGRYEEYYESGQVKIKGGYSRGFKSGDWTEYYPSGQMKLLEGHGWDTLHGVYKEFYSNGQIAVQARYEEGRQEYDYLEFYEDGSPKVKGFYELGKKTGKWFYWNQEGDRRKEKY